MYEKIKPILFASDLTGNSRRTFFYAASLSVLYNVEIILLHVIEKIPFGMRVRLAGLEGEETIRQLKEASKEDARKILIGKKRDTGIRRTLSEFYATISKEGDLGEFDIKDIVIKEGKIADEILNAVVDHECGLIVMGAHRGLLGAAGLGSATRTVLQKSKVPVLVVPVQETS
ncbi:universal stress protein [Desulfosarcina ovata subsp. sediminis]|uniref:Universal stress protein n=1 Tax=Desulfosarcina ovata subsp. sediminis TaxID=885957 RepID=A0A5K7ZM30_9BACT|nr:universal stress protein [Desulfosarcina ovata]BBO82041.1 universal stress protein [Desulfosarcina ovata subsp. sediminis]